MQDTYTLIGYCNYRGVLVVNSGGWQDQTDYMEKLGLVPTPDGTGCEPSNVTDDRSFVSIKLSAAVGFLWKLGVNTQLSG